MRKPENLKLTWHEKYYLESIVNGYIVDTFHKDDEEYLVFDNLKIRNICKTVILYSEGNSIDDIADTMKLSNRTIYNYLETYRKDHNFMKKLPVTNVSELQLYVDRIAKDFEHSKIKTYKQAQQRIEEITGIHRGITQIRAFLKNNYFVKNSKGYFYQRTSEIIRIQLKEKSKKVKNKSYLNTHPNEVEDYVNRIAASCNYRAKRVVTRLRERFDLKESDDAILDWVEKNTSLSK